jgi:hypothetical protein
LKTVGNLTISQWKNSSKVSKERRFNRDNPFYINTISPGPGGYNLQNKASLTQWNSKSSFDGVQTTNKNQFGNTFEKYKNVYYSELSKDFQNREGPGPGHYVNDSKPRAQKQYSFSKDDRKLSYNKKDIKKNSASIRYVPQADKAKADCFGTKFGTSRRDFDFTKCKG